MGVAAPDREIVPGLSPDERWNQRVDSSRSQPLGGDRALDRRDADCTPTSARGSGTAGRSGSRHGRRQAAEERRRASSTPTSPTAGRTRSRASAPIEGGPAPTATATRSSSTATPARSTSSTRSTASAAGWTAGSGAIWSLRSNRVAPGGLDVGRRGRAADPPGLARYDEVARAGSTTRCASPSRARGAPSSGPPATSRARSTDPALPPMGLRLRLKASSTPPGFPRQARVVLEALKRYGMILADNGSDWYVSRRARPALVERRPAHARPRARLRLRGRRHLLAPPLTSLDRPPRPIRSHALARGDSRGSRRSSSAGSGGATARSSTGCSRSPGHLRPSRTRSTARASGATSSTRRDARARCSSTPGIPEPRLFLTRSTCGRLRAFAGHAHHAGARLPCDGRLEGGGSTAVRLIVLRRAAETIYAVLVLAHESYHTIGVSDEAPNCYAIQAMAWTAAQLGSSIRGGRAARARDGGARAEAGRPTGRTSATPEGSSTSTRRPPDFPTEHPLAPPLGTGGMPSLVARA